MQRGKTNENDRGNFSRCKADGGKSGIKQRTKKQGASIYVTDTEKASKYLKTHNADYVLIKKDLFVQINLDKQTDRMIYNSQTDEKE